MKRFACLLVLALFACAGTPRAADPELKTDDDKTLYAIGLVISKQLAVFKLTPAEIEIVKSGLGDGLTGKPEKVKLDEFGPKIQGFAQQRASAGAAEEKKKGKEFMAKIAEKPGIKKTGTGLLMETITEGKGASPGPTDNVKVNYKGTRIDGTVFDSSEKHGGPSTISLTQVVDCWKEGLSFMKVGGKAKLYCPAEIAYADHGKGDIPPGATLVFDIELLEIVK